MFPYLKAGRVKVRAICGSRDSAHGHVVFSAALFLYRRLWQLLERSFLAGRVVGVLMICL